MEVTKKEERQHKRENRVFGVYGAIFLFSGVCTSLAFSLFYFFCFFLSFTLLRIG